jgi:ferrous iron transport protein A
MEVRKGNANAQEGLKVKAFPKIVRLVDITKINFEIMKRLSELGPGTVARIHSFEKNDLFLKLMEMGCVPGELIRVEQIAPFGDPISITVAGYNLSLRLDEAENIFMEEGL